MQTQLMMKYLQDIDLNLDTSTMEKVQELINHQIGIIQKYNVQLQVYGAVAIVSEIDTLPTIDKKNVTKNGIRIQNVMSHLGSKLSKQQFLDCVEHQLQKYNKTSPAIKNLIKKVFDVKLSYRFFKKYQQTFNVLFNKFFPYSQVKKQQYAAMFWIIYLYMKNQYIEVSNITQAKKLLILLFRAVFQQYLSSTLKATKKNKKINFEDIRQEMCKNIGFLQQVNQQMKEFYFNQFNRKLNYFYQRRFTQDKINFEKIQQNQTYLQRLLDDISNSYFQDRIKLKYFNQIDQISYLELKKDMTPQVFPQSLRFKNSYQNKQNEGIFKILDFNLDQQSNYHSQQQSDFINLQKQQLQQNQYQYQFENNAPQLIQQQQKQIQNQKNPENNQNNQLINKIEFSPFLNRQVSFGFQNTHLFQTPISLKIQNEIWIRKCIEASHQKLIQQPQSELSVQYDAIQQQIKQKNLQMIRHFMPKCPNYEEKLKQINKLFIYNYSELIKNNSLDFKKQNISLKSIATLSALIYNYGFSKIKSSYKEYCNIYGISLRQGFQSIQVYLVHYEDKMPIDMKDFIKNVEKRIIISQIWQNQQGYNILIQKDCNNQKQKQIVKNIKQKILKYGKLRIKQICISNKISQNLISKIFNILTYIFTEKPYLLKTNNLDQIILCCIMSCLSINQKQRQQNQSLIKLFTEYNSRIQFAYNSYQYGLKDKQGKQVDLIEYYNQVFLKQIQDMIFGNQTVQKTNDNNSKKSLKDRKVQGLDQILITPVRINISRQEIKNRIGLNLGNIKQQAQGGAERRKMYIQNVLRKQSSLMKQEDEQDEENMKSPRFGRVFSFRKGG